MACSHYDVRFKMELLSVEGLVNQLINKLPVGSCSWKIQNIGLVILGMHKIKFVLIGIAYLTFYLTRQVS